MSPAAVLRQPSAYSVRALAQRWDVSEDTIYAQIKAGRLQAFRFGGKLYRIRAEEVERFECRTDTPSSGSETNSPSSGETRQDATDIRLERLIDHRPRPRLVHSGSGDAPEAA